MAIKFKRTAAFLGSSSLTSPLLLLGTASALLGSNPALAMDGSSLPQGGTVTGGSATIAASGQTLTVNQTSSRAVIDWRSFNIGADAQANFNQPNSGSIAVNRVNGSTNPSEIDGGLHANGQVWILNPNGVLFGKTAHVDAAGIVATTANIDVKTFMAGSNQLQFSGSDSGEVANEGHITVGQGGLAAFVAPSVRNSGTIRATVGKVALAAGDTYTLDLAGDHLVEIGLGATKAVVDQSGKIVNPGGTIAITAKAASQVVDSVINVSGVTSASSVKTAGGQIILGADDINVASTATTSADGASGGQITAVANKTGSYAGSYSAQGSTGDGGQVETSGKTAQIASNIKVNTSASNGKTGNWTLDPDDLMVQSGGDGGISGGTNDDSQSTIDPSTVVTALNSTNVTLQAKNSVTVDSAINASTNTSAHNLTLADEDNNGALTINLNAPITLKSGAILSGQGSLVNVGSGGLIQNGIDAAASTGATVDVAAGTYDENLTISKSNLTLISNGGSASTSITGQGSSALGTILIANGANNFTLGGIGHGFTILGIDNASPGIESAAVYIGNNGAAISGVNIVGNEITAKGDYGLLTNSSATISNVEIDGNTFDGQTFAGSTPADNGFTNQFTDPNVPRQLVTLNPGTSNVRFTNNDVTGTAGGINSSEQEQGNTLVTIDSSNATITGNTFEGTTDRFGSQLRARGTAVTISGNTFDSADLGQNAGVLELNTTTVFTGLGGGAPSNLTQVMAANTFKNRAVWDANAAAGNTDYVVGVSLSAAIAGAATGDTINVQAGTYGGGVTLGKTGLTLSGATGSVIDVAAGQTGIAITANNVTVKGLEIVGPVTGSYEQVNWGTAGSSIGISVSGNVSTGPSGFNITGNDIQDIRTGIIVLGQSASGSITGNDVDNTKGGILIQYNDGTPYTISGNQQGAIGNEWGIVLNLNTSGGNTGQAPTSWQSALLALSTGNNGLTVMDRKYASANRTGVVVDASSTATAADDSNLGNGLGNARQPLATIQAGINAVVAGGTVNVDNGTYVIASGGGNYINVNKSLNLVGQSEEGVIIDARNASTYGLRVTAATGPVILSNFTLYGVTASGGYGLKAEGTQGLTLSNITSEGAYKSEFDLNGVVGGTLNGLTANGDMLGTSTPTAGNGISLTDSQDITITNSVTENNAWGGLALYQGTTYGSLQLTDITVDGSNTFSEANGIYAQNQSSVSIGTINLTGQGIQYIAQLTTPVTSGDGVYTLFQKTQQGAIDQAAGLNAKYSVAGAAVQGYAGTSLNGTNIFTVGQATDGDALSVNAALSQSSTGGVIDVLSGTYAEAVAIQAPRTINFDDVTLNSLTSSTGAAGSVLSGNVAAGSVALNGATVLGGNLSLDTRASNGNVTMAVVDGATAGGQALTILTGSGVLSLGNAGATTVLGSLSAGNVTLTGSTYDAGAIGLGAATLKGNATLTGNSVTLASVDGTTAGSQSLTVAANTDSLGNVGATTVLGSLSAGNVTLTGSTYDAGTIGLGGVTLSGNATLTGNSVTLASVDGTTAGSQSLTVAANTDSLGNVGATTALGSLSAGNVTLTGSTYDAGTIGLGAATLKGNAAFTGNSVTLASVDGTTAGSQSLTVTGNTATLGNLGATTRLGAVDVAANITLSGTNDAASFTFGGSVTLTAASTVLDTTLSSAAAGNITFTGAIFGTGDSGQSLTLSAGPGTNAASANGDITMANAGTTTVRLGTLNVSGNNFTALTVDLAGDFTSQLTGNQVFAADTLNAGGNVNTRADGNVSGHIVSAGSVALTTPGIVSGNIGGSSLVLNSGSVSNATLTGNSVNANVTNGFDATVNATNTANIAANTISGNIGGSSLVLNGGSVSNATLTGNSVNATVTNGFDATVNATNTANITASTISGSISGTTLTIGGGLVSNATLSGTTVNANITGGFNATVNASNSASIAANTISGNFSGATVTLSGQSVSGQVTATTLNVASQGGTVSGEFTPGNVTGFVDLNGQTTGGGPHVPGQQLVVENFALPAGTQIAANGALILPQGLVIGLLSPGGGPAKVIMVHDVQTLGQLLADGYVAIVIDLKNDKDAPVTVASN